MKPFIKPRPATPSPAGPAPSSAPRISPNELTIFSVASSLTDADERAAYLDRACGTDSQLRARLEERLNARAKQAAPPPSASVVPTQSELARPVREAALAAQDRPDAVALVPMSAMQLAASQQPPRHSPVPWVAATIMAIGVGALAVFFLTERKVREQAEQQTSAALQDKETAERERAAAAASALEAQEIAQRAEASRSEALRDKAAANAATNQAKAEADQHRAQREQAEQALKAAVSKAQAAEQEVAKLRAQTAAWQRANQLAIADSLARLGSAQMDARAYGEAEANLRQALQLRLQLQAEPWAIVENRVLLGTALMQRSQDGAALQEMQTAAAAFESLGAPANDTDRARATAASKRIVQFFSVTGRRRDATEWRKRLDAVLATR